MSYVDASVLTCVILDCVEFVFEKMLTAGLFPGCVNLLGNHSFFTMDAIANMLTSIYNAQRVGKSRVVVPYSRFKEQLAQLLQQRELVATVRVEEGTPRHLVVTLAYDEESGKPKIQGVKRLSTSGRRHYVKQGQVPYPITDTGAIILSTSQGLMDDGQARRVGIGGELVCEVW